jgi:methionine-rich copper-binding protein CopC
MKVPFITRAVLAALALGAAPLASAHAMPKIQSPAPGATVSAPHEVVINFGEALEPSFSTLAVSDAQGKDATRGKSSVDADNTKRMHVTLADLAPGTYIVKWTAVADDGHRTQGHYTFTVK